MTSHAPERLTQAGDAIVAARFSLTIDGVEIGQFSELVEISSGLDPANLALGSDQKSKPAFKKLPGKRVPPTVTLTRGLTGDLGVFDWHRDALNRAAARRNAALVFYDANGEAVARYHLESAWPAKIEISGLKAGSSEVLMETVTLTCEDIQRVTP